ncbi:MAG TPA: hypothetical protein VGJ07_21595 [Rugosimonospora sp.]
MRARTRLAAIGTSLALASTAALAAATPAVAADDTPTLTVTSTQALPALRQNPSVEGRDNGQSAGYGGRSVWIFDDTILKNPWGFLSNSGAVTSDLDASDGIDLLSDNPFTESSQGRPSQIIPLSPAEQAFQQAHAAPCATGDEYCGTVYGFWPGPVAADPAHHRILFTYGKLCRGAPDGTPCQNGFVGTLLGTGFAELDMLTHKVSRITVENPDPSITSPEGQDPTLLFPPNNLSFGAGEMVIRGNTLYAWGACDATTCGVAKVPVDQLQNRLAWRYYTGADAHGNPVWGTDPTKATVVGMVNGPAGGTVQYVPALHGYLNTYMSSYDNVGRYQTAPQPWGPWSAPKAMFTGLPTNTLWDYASFAHAEYSRRGGLTQYITYYRPEDEQQELVRVDFSLQHS